MIKKISVLLIAFILMLPVSVKADSYPKTPTDWKVTFNGETLESNYDEDDINEALKGMQPGDTADLEFTLVNAYKEAVDFWAGNQALKTLEDTRESTTGGAYTYQLTYTDPSGAKTVLYDSKTVGGENDDTTGEDGEDLTGLKGATNALSDLFLLGRVEPGKSAKLTLHIELDGETQGNLYQDTLAQLRFSFAVEIPATGTIIIPYTGTEGKGFLDNILANSELNYYLLGALASFLLTVVFGLLFYINRKGRKAYED